MPGIMPEPVLLDDWIALALLDNDAGAVNAVATPDHIVVALDDWIEWHG